MLIKGQSVTFHADDMHFVKKFGIMEATNMVLDFASTSNLPFVYDTYQLASLLQLRRSSMFKIVRKCNSYYRDVELKKNNGKLRYISAPLDILKWTQKCILTNILEKYPVSKFATAYRKGLKLVDNAKVHTSKKYILKMDLKDFFPSIGFEQVYSCVFNTRHFPKQIGVILTLLCCRNGVLPQGAPTSPAISNIVMRNFDDIFGAWCEKQGFSYTRYCDDITVSGNKSLYVAFVKAKAMLEKMGYEINTKKTHFLTNASCQTVTGLTVNERARIPLDYRRNLRQEIYYAQKFGVKDAVMRANREEYIVDGKVDEHRYISHLEGKVQYILQIEPENEYFKKALKTVQNLRPLGNF